MTLASLVLKSQRQRVSDIARWLRAETKLLAVMERTLAPTGRKRRKETR